MSKSKKSTFFWVCLILAIMAVIILAVYLVMFLLKDKYTVPENVENMKILEDCKKYTMVSESHLKFLEKIISEVNKDNISGSIVECGVWKGGCCMWMLFCQKKYNMNRKIYLYDTFDGMTKPDSEKDDTKALNIYNQTLNKEYNRDYDKWHGENKWAYAPIDYVKNNINSIKYNDDNIIYVKGDVCNTLNKTIPTKISLLRLDTDWYNSTKKELDILFPLVSINGYIIVDDYYAWKGSRVATDEFMEKNIKNIQIINKDLTGGIFVMKKLK